MLRVGFEPTTQEFELLKTLRALDRTVSVIDIVNLKLIKIKHRQKYLISVTLKVPDGQ
jgi:hypothetical protein